jgi:hypothetical protein
MGFDFLYVLRDLSAKDARFAGQHRMQVAKARFDKAPSIPQS